MSSPEKRSPRRRRRARDDIYSTPNDGKKLAKVSVTRAVARTAARPKIYALLGYAPRRDSVIAVEEDDKTNLQRVFEFISERFELPSDLEDAVSKFGPHSGTTFEERAYVAFRHGKLSRKTARKNVDAKICLDCLSNDHWREACPEKAPLT